MKRIFIFFLMLPVGGMILYYLPLWVLHVQGKGSYDRESLVKRMAVRREHEAPEIEKEINIVPIEDAMAVSSNREKRTLLLDQLKGDIFENYRTVLAAGADSDSESAHYVAAAKMEVYRRNQSSVLASKRVWEEETENDEKRQAYLGELKDHISSGLLAEKEAEIYKEQYCTSVFEAMGKDDWKPNGEQPGTCLNYLVDLGMYEKAEAFWKMIRSEDKTGQMYDTMLQMYYDSRDREKFYGCIDQLCASDLTLSPKELRMVRYWAERRAR